MESWTKINPKTIKIGKKCFISYKGNDKNYVKYFGQKDGMYLFEDLKFTTVVHKLPPTSAKQIVYEDTPVKKKK